MNSILSALQVKFRCVLCGYMYSRKDTLKDHIRVKHSICLPTELNRLVQVFIPKEEKEGRRNKNVANMEQKSNSFIAQSNISFDM